MTPPLMQTVPVDKLRAPFHLSVETRWLAFVLAWFGLLAWASWGRLGHLILDLGHEVEIPARLAEGQLLYRDVEAYYGPLSYYINALALVVFGHHLEVLYGVGLVLALAAALLVYRLASQLTDARWGALCTASVLLVCAFAPGMFNFVLPYSYGAAYATVLCLLAFLALAHYTRTGLIGWLVVAAAACGLAGLAKQEYGVAALAAVLVGSNLSYPYHLQARVWRSSMVTLIAGACVLVPLALLAQQVSWEEIHTSLFPTSKLKFFAKSELFQVSPMKTLTSWWGSFKLFLPSFLVVLGVVTVTRRLLKSSQIPGPPWVKASVESLLSVGCSLGVLLLLKKLSSELESAYGLAEGTLNVFAFHPLDHLHWLLPLLVGWFALTRPRPSQDEHAPLLWTLLVYALLLNARWLFYIEYYGLYATPVIILFFVLLYRSDARTSAWQILLACLLLSGGVRLAHFGMYRYAVSSAQGTLYTREVYLASIFNQAVNIIQTSGATSVLVLPEGSVLNFLTATRTPSRETSFIPGVLPTPEAEQEFLTRMRADPPDLIVYIDIPFDVWGYKNYAEFNPLVHDWITRQHRLAYDIEKGGICIYAPLQ